MRLAHFTDPHFTEDPRRLRWRELANKRLLGWVNLRFLGRHAALTSAERVVRALVADLAEQDLDHIVCTGDFTGLSLPREFEAARAALAPLLAGANATRVTAIPGNHDVYVRAAERQRLYEAAFDAWSRTDLEEIEFAEMVSTAHPYPLVRLLPDDVALICLRDARPAPWYDSSGVVPPVQLQALAFVLEHPKVKGRTKVLALHYGLRRADGSPDSRLHGLRNGEELLRLIEHHGVSLVVHGHLHSRFVHPAGAVSPVAIANPGAVAYEGKAKAYHVLEIQDGRVHLEARRYSESADAFEAWPDASGSGLITAV